MKLGNDNIYGGVEAPDQAAAEKAIGDFLDALRIDWKNDPNMEGTPERVARMYIEELFAGRYAPEPRLVDFSTSMTHDSMHMSGPWDINSTCSHHLAPVTGSCIIGLVPSESSALPGLSKFGRVAQWFGARPQIQEDMVEQIADFFQEKLQPIALGVYLELSHGCCTHRGIKSRNSRFVTTALRGTMFENDIRQEFISSCHHLMRVCT